MDDLGFKDLPLLYYIIVTGAFGGIVASIEEQRRGKKKMRFHIRVLAVLGSAVTSGFAGLLTYWLYAAFTKDNSPSPFMFFLVGVSGWLGSKSIDAFVMIWKAFIQYQANKYNGGEK